MPTTTTNQSYLYNLIINISGLQNLEYFEPRHYSKKYFNDSTAFDLVERIDPKAPDQTYRKFFKALENILSKEYSGLRSKEKQETGLLKTLSSSQLLHDDIL